MLSLSLAVLVDTGAASLSRTAPAGAGAYLVQDTVPGRDGSIPAQFVPVAGTLFFTNYDAHEHGRELWKSDGTDAGTVMVKDIWLGSENGVSVLLPAVGETLYFTADDGTTVSRSGRAMGRNPARSW